MTNFAYQEPQCNKTVRLRHPLIGNRSRVSALPLTLQRAADPGEEVLARLACRESVDPVNLQPGEPVLLADRLFEVFG